MKSIVQHPRLSYSFFRLGRAVDSDEAESVSETCLSVSVTDACKVCPVEDSGLSNAKSTVFSVSSACLSTS